MSNMDQFGAQWARRLHAYYAVASFRRLTTSAWARPAGVNHIPPSAPGSP
jgi:hypothetical protein